MIIRFLSCAIILVSKLTLVIGLMRLNIVDPDRLAYVILLNQAVDLINCDYELITVDMRMLAKSS